MWKICGIEYLSEQSWHTPTFRYYNYVLAGLIAEGEDGQRKYTVA